MHFIIHIILGRNFSKLDKIAKEQQNSANKRRFFFPFFLISFSPKLAKLIHHKRRDLVGCTSLLDFI